MLKQQVFGAIGLMVVGFFYLIVIPIINKIFTTAYGLNLVSSTPGSGACSGVLSQLACVGQMFSNLDILVEGMLALILCVIFLYMIVGPFFQDPSGYSL